MKDLLDNIVVDMKNVISMKGVGCIFKLNKLAVYQDSELSTEDRVNIYPWVW